MHNTWPTHTHTDKVCQTQPHSASLYITGLARHTRPKLSPSPDLPHSHAQQSPPPQRQLAASRLVSSIRECKGGVAAYTHTCMQTGACVRRHERKCQHPAPAALLVHGRLPTYLCQRRDAYGVRAAAPISQHSLLNGIAQGHERYPHTKPHVLKCWDAGCVKRKSLTPISKFFSHLLSCTQDCIHTTPVPLRLKRGDTENPTIISPNQCHTQVSSSSTGRCKLLLLQKQPTAQFTALRVATTALQGSIALKLRCCRTSSVHCPQGGGIVLELLQTGLRQATRQGRSLKHISRLCSNAAPVTRRLAHAVLRSPVCIATRVMPSLEI